MGTFELELWDDEGRLCTFYSVRKEGADDNETNKFLLKYKNDEQYAEDVQSLLSFLLYAIGDDHGAVDALFNRYENEVTGLPSQGFVQLGELNYHFPNFSLRLYALRVTETIVVLFNGGVKDGSTNQTSSLHSKWKEACGFAKRIVKAFSDGDIQVDSIQNRLIDYLGNDEMTL